MFLLYITVLLPVGVIKDDDDDRKMKRAAWQHNSWAVTGEANVQEVDSSFTRNSRYCTSVA